MHLRQANLYLALKAVIGILPFNYILDPITRDESVESTMQHVTPNQALLALIHASKKPLTYGVDKEEILTITRKYPPGE